MFKKYVDITLQIPSYEEKLPFLLQRITIQTVAIAMAMTAHPTVTVVKIATKGTSESPELDHLDPVKR